MHLRNVRKSYALLGNKNENFVNQREEKCCKLHKKEASPAVYCSYARSTKLEALERCFFVTNRQSPLLGLFKFYK